MKLTSLVLAGSLAGCSAGAASYLPSKETPATATPVRAASLHDATSKYIYVGDAKQQLLLVYPAGVADPAPIREVPLGDVPQGIATDGRGNVYVALFNSSTVDEFSRGATTLVKTITNDIYKPTGVAVDERGTLYVASHCQSSCETAYVAEFVRGSDTAAPIVDAPASYGVEGIAVRHNVLFMDIYNGPGAFAARYVGGSYTGLKIPLAGCAGLALDDSGNLLAASAGALATYAPPSYDPVKSVDYIPDDVIRYVGRGTDGSIYVPLDGGSPAVMVLPSGSQAPYAITTGLVAPLGAAAD
jgi:hypothetical protein